jgi:aspartyl-tRNA(Asn)/glutamyl-tRNA(Gln) amidotransferase subunit C
MTDGQGSDDAPAVDAGTVRHVADLARVDLTDAEVERFAAEIAEVLDYFAALDDVPAVEADADLTNVLRPDAVTDSLPRDEALRNAPGTDDGHVKGPHV